MNRRTALLAPWWLAPAVACAQSAGQAAEEGPQRLATAWRVPSAAPGDSGDRVGIWQLDWARARLQLVSEIRVPARAHGLLALADGGFVAVANRPGRWLLRADADGRVMRKLTWDGGNEKYTLNGHVAVSAEGLWLYSTETDPISGAGVLAVRDARTLERVARLDCGVVDPHHLLWAPDGSLLVAGGGIVRDALGRKLEGERMAPALVRMDAASGRVLGRWELPDPQLSIRHLAWSAPAADGTALLGLALQAEHPRAEERERAPTLAIWDGRALSLPCTDARGGGYAGDIAAAAGGGFVISAQKQGRCLWWQPAEPLSMTLVAELREPCALLAASDGAGVLIGAARGLARWHARLPAAMLAWPMAMAPDNHAVRLAAI